MADEKVKKQLNKCITKLESQAHENIKRQPGQRRSIYYDMLDAASICRDQMSKVPESNDDVTYIAGVISALKTARARYRYEAADEGGYGVSTFRSIINGMSSLFESRGGQEQD